MTSTAAQMQAYLRGAFALQRMVVQNDTDRQLVQGSANPAIDRIAYVFDADIVVWYTRPLNNVEYSSIFGVENEDEDFLEETRPEDQLNAILTLQNLFSGRLLGQRDYPIFMSPEHLEELDNKLDPILKSVESMRASDLVDVSSDLKQLRELTSGQQLSAQQLTEAIKKFSDILTTQAQSGVYAAAQFLRLFQSSRLVPLGRAASPEWEVVSVPKERRDYWLQELTSRKKGARSGAKHGRDLQANLARDAGTIARVEALNEFSKDFGVGVRYVLVTGDHAIHSAVEASLRTQRKHLWSSANFVRHPKQYIPILNVEERSEFSELRHSKVLSDLLGTMQDLIRTYYSLKYRRKIPDYDLDLSPFGGQFAADISQLLNADEWSRLSANVAAMQSKWTQALVYAARLNLGLLRDNVIGGLSEFIDRVVSVADERQARSNLLAKIGELTKAHLNLAIQGRLARLLSDSKQGAGGLSRAPLLIRYSFRSTAKKLGLGDNDLDGFNSVIRRMHEDGTQRQFAQLSRGIEASSPEEAALLASALSLRASAWSAARHYADRGIKFLEQKQRAPQPLSDDETRAKWELRYLWCVASRFAWDTESSYHAIKEILQACLNRHTNREGKRPERFRRARALSELGALELFAIYRARLLDSQSENLSADEIVSRLRRAKEYLLSAMRTLEDPNIHGVPPRQLSELSLHALRLQIATNIVSAAVFELLTAPAGASVHIPTVESHLRNLQALLQQGGDKAFAAIPMCDLYGVVLECAILRARREPTESAARAVVDMARQIQSKKQSMEELDLKEVDWFVAWAQSLARD